ncbi:MAG: SDR family oxidoreductase [Anaerolineae bacterium]|nr:SDR family oxidoreductase [Anaerolineae bacterium]
MSTQSPRMTALITGASSGIGMEFARQMAGHGHNVVLVARSEDRLKALAAKLEGAHGIRAWVFPADLNDPQAPNRLVQQLEAERITVDILVNNAGFATYGHFATEIDLAKELEMLQVNIVALTHLTKLLVRPMLDRKRGYILNVASTAAFQPGPLMTVYYASKAYVLSFSEGLAGELEGTGVSVTALCPGPTESGFQKRAAMEDSRLVQGGLMSVTEVVREGYKGLMSGQTVVIPGWFNRLGALLPRFVPRKMAARIVMRMQSRVSH